MARTAVVNPRGRGGRFVKRARSKPRSSYGRAANPRRRRRHHRRRRRNPSSSASSPVARSPYASVSYYRSPNRRRSSAARRRNPEFSMNDLIRDVPAATAGVWAARWAVKQSGEWEAAQDGTLEPGIKQALAIWLAAHVGADLLGNLLGSPEKARIAQIAALGYGGDLFMRARFMRDSQFVQQNLSLQGMEASSAIGSGQLGADTYVDPQGNTWVATASGWQLAGDSPAVYVLQPGDDMQGMEASSAIGRYGRGRRAASRGASSFGYV